MKFVLIVGDVNNNLPMFIGLTVIYISEVYSHSARREKLKLNSVSRLY